MSEFGHNDNDDDQTEAPSTLALADKQPNHRLLLRRSSFSHSLPNPRQISISHTQSIKHHIIHHGTKSSNQRAGTIPRSIKVGHFSSRSCRPGHSSYFGHSYLCLWRAPPDAKHPKFARRCSIPQLLHTARAIRLGHMGRIPRYVSTSTTISAHRKTNVSPTNSSSLNTAHAIRSPTTQTASPHPPHPRRKHNPQHPTHIRQPAIRTLPRLTLGSRTSSHRRHLRRPPHRHPEPRPRHRSHQQCRRFARPQSRQCNTHDGFIGYMEQYLR